MLAEAAPVEAMDADGRLNPVEHGRNLHLVVRPEAPVQLLFTGHMDTVFGADHAFQKVFWREEGVLGGPGVADMKGGLAVMLAALQGVEAAGIQGLGYEVVINSDEEVGSPGSAALIADAARAPPFDAFCLGTAEYPDRSTTLVLEVQALGQGRRLSLSGPGIADVVSFAAAPLPLDLGERLLANRALFPRGVDLILVAPDAVVALPRSVRVAAEGA